MYKTLPTNRRSLPLEVESPAFADVWKACIKNQKSDLTVIMQMMEPVFACWQQQLIKQDLKTDMMFLTLCQMLDPDPEEALSKVTKWVEWAESSSSVIEELRYIFIERIRKIKYEPSSASDKMIEYIVAKDFKRGLYHHIRAINRLKARDALFYSEMFDEEEFATYIVLPDHYMLNIIKSNQWNSYLFHLISQGYTTVERSELTKLHRRNLYKEEKKLCQLLKLKQ